ncbi:purine-nucleoside phosphorylase [Akkermansia muciniphila]|uniref:purine-nucleoside phosphorylase n=1 Tax=Akkermansia muciniphila TaxID=239935 RepID=UPI00122EFDC0|nr:purine-nucleoside phosphorylase [Akkermansia muciniphila]
MKYNFTLDYFQKSADYILSKIDEKPEIALILGSALGGLSEEIENPVVIDYKDIPNFLVSTVKSHAGKLIIGKLHGKTVVCMSGRFHYYEGYDFEQLVIPIRVFKLIGCKATILTNAAGAINTDFNVGDIMIIKDHIKLMGASPLRGPNVEELGPRFFDVTDMYTKELRELAKNCAAKLDMKLQEGVYYYHMGPNFETPAEIRAMRTLGADAVGMSTVTEALTAAHCGMKLLGLSLMTNMAAGVLDQPVDGDEVSETGERVAKDFRALLAEIVKAL